MRITLSDATAAERRALAALIHKSFPGAEVIEGGQQAYAGRPPARDQGASATIGTPDLGADVQAAALFPLENPNPVLRVGRDGVLLFANRASERLLRAYGAAKEGLLPDHWRQLAADVFEDGRPRRVEVEIDNEVFEFDAVPILDAGYVNLYGRNVTERKHVEDQLRQSEAVASDLIRYAPSGIYEVAFPSGRFRSVNDAMCQILGYRRDELLAMSAFDLLDDEGKRLFADRIRRVLAGETVDPAVEYRVKRRDGGVIYSALNIRITFHDGQPDGAFVIAHDVTGRRRAVEELREAKGQLEARVQERTRELALQAQRLQILHEIDRSILAARAPKEIAQAAVERVQQATGARRVAVAWFDGEAEEAEILAFAGCESSQLDVGARWPLAMGWMIDEILAGRVAVIADLADLPDTEGWKAERTAQGIRSVTMIPMKARDKVLGQLTIHRAEPGPLPPEIMELAQHVTDSLAIAIRNARLTEELRYQAQVLENVYDAVIGFDSNLRVTAWNRAAEAQYGWQLAEALGAFAPDVVGSHLSEEERAASLQVLAQGGRWRGEVGHTRRDGTAMVIEATSVPLRDEEDQIIGYVTVNRDVTARKRAEEELRASREQLRDLSRRVVELQENERHEVANRLYNESGQRLSAVLLDLKMLERDERCDPAIAARLAGTSAAIDGVLRDMHGLAVSLRPASLDHLGLGAALQQYARDLASRSGIEVRAEVGALESVPLEPLVQTSIYRIVQAAVDNAVQHGHAHCISVTAAKHDGQLTVIVEDDGRGFDVQEALQDGSLGLLGMRERAETLGGTLTVESRPGKGTEVYIQVPIPTTP